MITTAAYPLSSSNATNAPRRLEKLSGEIIYRTRVVRTFCSSESCLRLIRVPAVETHEGWLKEHLYLNMDLLASTHTSYCGNWGRRPRRTKFEDIIRRHYGKTSVIPCLLLYDSTDTTRNVFVTWDYKFVW